MRAIQPGEEDLWANTAAAGWGETEELAEFVCKIGEVVARSQGSFCEYPTDRRTIPTTGCVSEIPVVPASNSVSPSTAWVHPRMRTAR